MSISTNAPTFLRVSRGCGVKGSSAGAQVHVITSALSFVPHSHPGVLLS